MEIAEKSSYSTRRVFAGRFTYLINLENDPGEMYNLAAENPERVEELKDLYEIWAERYQ